MSASDDVAAVLAFCTRRADELRAHAEASFYPKAATEYRAKECAYREVIARLASASHSEQPRG